MSALGYGGPNWSEGDSPRPGERPEDRGGYDTFWTHRGGRLLTEEEKAERDRMAEAVRELKAQQEGEKKS